MVLWELFYPTHIWEDLYSEYFFMLQNDSTNPNLYADSFLISMIFPFVEHMTFLEGIMLSSTRCLCSDFIKIHFYITAFL